MKRPSLKFKENECYLVRFMDHTAGTKEIVEVEVVAWFLEDRKNHIVLSPWRIDSEDSELVSNNHEPISIIKSCITRFKRLDLPRWKKSEY